MATGGITTKELIKQRISQLIGQLNKGVSKKQRRVIIKELTGYGIIPIKTHAEVVTLKTDDGLEYTRFVIDGRVKAGDDIIIGFYCTDCCIATSVNGFDDMFIEDTQNLLMECTRCKGYEVQPIYERHIVK